MSAKNVVFHVSIFTHILCIFGGYKLNLFSTALRTLYRRIRTSLQTLNFSIQFLRWRKKLTRSQQDFQCSESPNVPNHQMFRITKYSESPIVPNHSMFQTTECSELTIVPEKGSPCKSTNAQFFYVSSDNPNKKFTINFPSVS